MRHILAHLNALRKHWGTLASGGAIIGGLGIWQGTGHTVPGWIYWTIALVDLLIAAFLAWRDQLSAAEGHLRQVAELEKRIYDGRPLFILTAYRVGEKKVLPAKNEWSFRVKNCGSRPARWVRLEQIPSYKDNFNLSFGTIPVLPPGGEEHLGYEVNPKRSLDSCQLYEFLDDHGPDYALGWWDVTIKFRDTDDHVGEELVRLCYDAQYDVLYGTAVPYTERGFKGDTLNPT